MISRRTLLTLASATGFTAAATACGNSSPTKSNGGNSGSDAGGSDGGGSDAGGSAAPVDSKALLESVTVEGAVGKEPKVTVKKPLEFAGYHSKVVTKGSGEKVKKNATIVTRSAIFDAKKGELLASRWQDKSVGVFAVNEKTIGPDATAFFASASVGTRYLMAGEAGGQKVVEVGDIDGIALPRAKGKSKDLPKPLPAIKLGKDGNPQLAGKPEGAPPKKVVEGLSIEGDGAVAKKGDTLVMHYRGWEWESGKEFDASWSRGTPFSFPLGQGKVIAGWDTVLEGKKAGSQVVMAIPPDQAYKDQTELGGKTLLFVADILYIAAPAA